MAGILDQSIYPQTQGLLQAAFAGLQASGPSRMPVSLGQVIGQGGAAGMGAFNQAQQQQQQMALRDAQIKNAQLDVALQEQLTGAMGGGGILGKGMTDPDTMEAVGMRLAAAGRPGGAGLINAAQRVRQKRAAEQQLGVMKSTSGAPVDTSQEGTGSMDMSGTAGPAKTGGAPGIFGTLFNSPYVGPQAKALQAQVDAAPAGADPEAMLKHYDRLQAAHLAGAAQDRAITDRQQGREQASADRAAAAEQAAADRRSLAGFIAGARNPQIIQSDKGIFQLKDGKLEPLQDASGAPLRPTASGRIENTTANQLQRQFNADVKPNTEALGSTLVYRDALATGDNAQASMMAAEALRRSARGGSTRFKGEADRILGSGYGSGSIAERMENFLSQEFKGAPSANTMDKLDKLVGATELANLEAIAQKVKRFGGQGKARGIPEKDVIGMPLVQGSYVIFPEGDLVKFKSRAEADAKAQEWQTAHQ